MDVTGKKIAVIKSNYTPFGGAEKYTTAVLRAFTARGFSVDLLTAYDGEWGGDIAVNRVRIPRGAVNNIYKTFTFNRNAGKYLNAHFDEYSCVLNMDRTVMATHVRAGGGCHRAWLERRRPHVSAIRNFTFFLNPFHRYSLMLEKESLRSPRLRKLICNSRMVRDEFLRYYGIDEKKLAVVHNGVQWKEFEAPFEEALQYKTGIRKSLGLSDDGFYFLYVGSGYERKGLQYAMSALTALPQDCSLIVIGKDRYEGKYKALGNSMGLGGRVVFLGPRTDVVQFLKASDVFVLPTIYDPFSNATLEALAMGLFTVTSDANGCSEVIADGCGAVVRDLRNRDELVDAMRRALSAHDRRRIRDSVREYDFDIKLAELVDLCLNT